MAIGERIRFFRNLRGMTQKYLGIKLGFSERTADIRMAQYEAGTRTPKASMVESLAYVLEVSPQALFRILITIMASCTRCLSWRTEATCELGRSMGNPVFA